MVGLISFLQPPKNRDSGGHGGLTDEDGLEAAFEGGIFLDVLPMGGEGRREGGRRGQ